MPPRGIHQGGAARADRMPGDNRRPTERLSDCLMARTGFIRTDYLPQRPLRVTDLHHRGQARARAYPSATRPVAGNSPSSRAALEFINTEIIHILAGVWARSGEAQAPYMKTIIKRYNGSSLFPQGFPMIVPPAREELLCPIVRSLHLLEWRGLPCPLEGTRP